MIPCSWRLVLCGINHTTAPLAVREPLQISRDVLARADALLVDLDGVQEALVLSTCNRVECYLVADANKDGFDIVREFFLRLNGFDVAPLKESFYYRKDKHAIDHLFRVAAAIDSMVLGENQIQGQLKDAYRSACTVKSAGKIIHRLFHQAFRIGKQVRTDTDLGIGACSVAGATTDLIRPKLKGIDNPLILFVGVNRMISLAATRLNRLGYGNYIFVNRTIERAREYARQYRVEGFGLDELPRLLGLADAVITCTASTQPLITDAIMAAIPGRNPQKPLLIADMANPRDVDLREPHDGVEVYNLDSVQTYIKNQQSRREEALPAVEQIIEMRLEQFVYWFDQVRHEPAYNGLGEAFEKVRQQTIESMVGSLSEESLSLVDRATRQMTRKLLSLKTRNGDSNERMEE